LTCRSQGRSRISLSSSCSVASVEPSLT